MDSLREKRSRGTSVDLDEMANSLSVSVAPNDRTATLDFVRAMDGLSADHRQIPLSGRSVQAERPLLQARTA